MKFYRVHDEEDIGESECFFSSKRDAARYARSINAERGDHRANVHTHQVQGPLNRAIVARMLTDWPTR